MALLERQLQLDALDEYAADVRRGEGRLALVSGEAGVGKSALLEEFERRLPDARWSWGVCDGLSTPRPLGPLLDIAADLGGPLQEAVGAGRSREEIFQALLTEATTCRPQAVLVFEDVHWADEATLDLLRFVGRRIRRTPVLLLVTYRDDEVPGGHPLRTCLSQLAPEPGTRRIDVPRLTPARSACSPRAPGSSRTRCTTSPAATPTTSPRWCAAPARASSRRPRSTPSWAGWTRCRSRRAAPSTRPP